MQRKDTATKAEASIVVVADGTRLVSIVVDYHHYYSDTFYLLLPMHVLPPTYLSEVPTYLSTYLSTYLPPLPLPLPLLLQLLLLLLLLLLAASPPNRSTSPSTSSNHGCAWQQ